MIAEYILIEEDALIGGGGGTPSFTISPTSGLLGTTSVAVTGTNNVWLSVPPVFTALHGTISNVAVSGNNAATYDYVSAGVDDTITDNSTGATASFTVAAATAFYATGPTRGGVNIAETYTLHANGTTTATVTGHTTGTGSFAATVALNGTSAVTLSYTPTDYTDSPHTLSFTDSASLTDPTNISLTVTQFPDGSNGSLSLRLQSLGL